MKRSIRAMSLVAAGALTVSLGVPTLADAQERVTVEAGESIQEAIDNANPNTIINVEAGTYEEQLLVKTDNIKLVGDGVTLVPGGEAPEGSPCADPSEPEGTTGICVAGDWAPPASEEAPPTLLRRVANVTVSGFTVRDFEYGVFGLGTDHLTVEKVTAIDNTEYGIFSNTSVATKIRHNTATGSEDAGIYVGDSPDANAEVAYNETSDNFLGLFIRDTRSGIWRNNFSHGNCVGVLLLDTGAPSPSGDIKLEGNLIHENNRACPGDEAEGIPPLSGAGVLVLGSDGNVFRNNSVVGNEPSLETGFAGGIVFASSAMFGGSTAERNDVRANVLTDNEPADVIYENAGARTANVVVANLGAEIRTLG